MTDIKMMRQLRVPITTRILSVSGVSLGIFSLALLYVMKRTVSQAVGSETDESVLVARNVLRDLVLAKGMPSLVAGRLLFGDWDPSLDRSLVNHLKLLTGADAAIYGIVDGKPARLTTTIERQDGSGRDIGAQTVGREREALDGGESFSGRESFAFQDYMVRYDALRSSGGDLIGYLYVSVPLARMHAAARETTRAVTTVAAFASLPSLIALYVTVRPMKRTFRRAVAVAQGLALGNVDQPAERFLANDELGEVETAFGKMIAYLHRMSTIADAISQGDLSTEIVPASSSDRLGNAFVRMTLNLRELVGRLESTALTDNLTQLGNRRAFDSRLESEISRTARCGGNLALALIDVDNFKLVNDGFGHQRGDAVLATLGSILKGVRLEDVGFRLGGDEFALIFPSTTTSEARFIMERIRAAVQAQLSGTTVSVGIAASTNGLVDAKTLRRNADAALYFGKQHGRNSVVVSDQTMTMTKTNESATLTR